MKGKAATGLVPFRGPGGGILFLAFFSASARRRASLSLISHSTSNSRFSPYICYFLWLLPNPSYRNSCDYIGPAGIIQNNVHLKIFNLVTSTKFFSHRSWHSQVPGVRKWTSLGCHCSFQLSSLSTGSWKMPVHRWVLNISSSWIGDMRNYIPQFIFKM